MTGDETRTFQAMVLENPVNRAILARLGELAVGEPWLVAGCLYGTVWNLMSGRPVGENIKDYDVFYYDADTSYDAEDRVIRRGAALFADLGVEVEIRNQARVPLWFEGRFGAPYPPLASAREAIDRFVVAGTCCGIAPSGELHATYGVGDILAGRLAYNPLSPTPHEFHRKAGTYKARWPWLEIVEPVAPRGDCKAGEAGR